MPGQSKLRGIFTPNMVPLDGQGRIDEAELRRYVDWLIEHGVDGLYPNGSTSEFTRFTPDERRRIVAIMTDQAAGRVPVLAGAAEANVRETLATCEYYHGLGVRAVAIVSPFYYRLSPDNVYAYFREIGRHTPVDVTLYNIPMFASPIDVPTLQRLADECERIVAIKDSSGDVPQMMRMIEAVRPNRPDFSFMTGWDAVLMPMLLVGCDGGTNASSGVVPELTRKVYQLTTAAGKGDGSNLPERPEGCSAQIGPVPFSVSEVVPLQNLLRKFFDAMLTRVDFPEGFRVGIELRGIRMGQGRQPLSDGHRQRLAALRQELAGLLREAGLDEGEAGRTAEPLLGSLDIRQIVEGVVAALQARGVT